MYSITLTDKLLQLTKQSDPETALQALIPEFLKLKIFFLKSQIAQYELRWGMSYEEFEKKSVEMPNGFTLAIEQEYYEWGEKEALLKFYQNDLKQWV